LSSDLVRKEDTSSRKGGELDTFAPAIIANCFPREESGKLPRAFLFRKSEPFDQDLQLSLIIPAVVQKSFENEFRALLNLIAYLKEGLGPTGPGPLGIPCRWCGGTSGMLTAHSTETPSALHQIPMSIGLYHHVEFLGLKLTLLWRTGVGI